MAGSRGSSCPSCGSTRRRVDKTDGLTFCGACGREYEPYELGEQPDPMLDAQDFDVTCPECGRAFVMRAWHLPSAARIEDACGHA